MYALYTYKRRDSMRESIAQEIYDSLWGGTIEEYRIPWVEDATVEGSLCMKQYVRILEAYERLVARLGQTDEDQDVETIINSMLDIQRELCLKMFEYGRIYEKMLL